MSFGILGFWKQQFFLPALWTLPCREEGKKITQSRWSAVCEPSGLNTHLGSTRESPEEGFFSSKCLEGSPRLQLQV